MVGDETSDFSRAAQWQSLRQAFISYSLFYFNPRTGDYFTTGHRPGDRCGREAATGMWFRMII
jgi:hypothetical protein